MADKLTLQAPGALETPSRFSNPSDSANEDEPPPSPERGDFLSGVRRGIKKWGSVSGNRARPPTTQLGETSLPTLSEPASAAADTETNLRVSRKHERRTSSLNREKPLPAPPQSPPLAEEPPPQNIFSPPDTPKAPTTMSRQGAAGSRTSTMDSSTSGSQSYGGAFGSNQSNGTGPARQVGEDDSKDTTTPRSNGPPSAGPSPAQPRSAGGQTIGTPGTTPATHLSGLMCNVHRTTGREPHPLTSMNLISFVGIGQN
ncbi:hypothetical protein M7I_7965 [Glarea lozoyensis 74030]|uniref:Uncharacterized protein n=1 Tax=Glarea lozoyensis (strain ATCC 74030 / MF5533) TaxID=1104152 RepID=H0EYQ7_GLAL7|nr:hypothetical protein M7I_7965 [Glarea lozoyensis 74030]